MKKVQNDNVKYYAPCRKLKTSKFHTIYFLLTHSYEQIRKSIEM